MFGYFYRKNKTRRQKGEGHIWEIQTHFFFSLVYWDSGKKKAYSPFRIVDTKKEGTRSHPDTLIDRLLQLDLITLIKENCTS